MAKTKNSTSAFPTERQRYRDTEILRDRDTEDTEDTEDSASASRVATLQEAVRLSLRDGIDGNCLFRYARALKALEMTTGTPTDLGAALSLWWALAKPYLPSDAGEHYDEYLLTLEQAYESARIPIGENALLEALSRAPSIPYKPSLAQREERLKKVCEYLQQATACEPFFISVRDAAKVIQTDDLKLAHNLLRRLVRNKFMQISKVGNRIRATRYVIPTRTG